jgi:hypothetical protein
MQIGKKAIPILTAFMKYLVKVVSKILLPQKRTADFLSLIIELSIILLVIFKYYSIKVETHPLQENTIKALSSLSSSIYFQKNANGVNGFDRLADEEQKNVNALLTKMFDHTHLELKAPPGFCNSNITATFTDMGSFTELHPVATCGSRQAPFILVSSFTETGLLSQVSAALIAADNVEFSIIVLTAILFYFKSLDIFRSSTNKPK